MAGIIDRWRSAQVLASTTTTPLITRADAADSVKGTGELHRQKVDALMRTWMRGPR